MKRRSRALLERGLLAALPLVGLLGCPPPLRPSRPWPASSQGPSSEGPSSEGPSSQGPSSEGPSSQGPSSQEPSSPAGGGPSPAPRGPGPEAREPPAARPPLSLEAACASCHPLPPPDALPRAAWPEAIASMGALAPHLRPSDLEVAREHYAARAPEALSRAAPAPLSSSVRVERLRPGRAQATPAVSRLRWVPLGEGPEPSLLACEMRLSSLYRIDLRAVERVARYLNGPVQVHRADLEGDGREELVVTGIGDPSPSSEKKGWVALLRAWPVARPPERLLEQLGRPANLELGDLDRDGDLDLVICAFGFRGPGELTLATQVEPGRFERRTLDPRDGFVAALVRDLDRDGLQDVVALVAQEHEQLVWLRQTAPGRFAAEVLHAAPHPGWGYSCLSAADLDGDGDEDLVLANGDAADHPVVVKPYHGVAWLERLPGDAPRYRYHRVGSLPGCESLAVGDVDGDGDLDLAAGSFLPLLQPHEWRERELDSLVWFEQRPAGEWRRHVLERAYNTRASVAIGDLDGDGRAEVAAGNFLWRGARDAPLVTVYSLTND